MSGYWANNYWNPNYFNGDYWADSTLTVSASLETLTLSALTPAVDYDTQGDVTTTLATLTLTALSTNPDVDSQDYFNDDYWGIHYWSPNYWGTANVGGDDINQQNPGTLTLTSFQTFAGGDLTVFAPTETLTLSGFNVAAANTVTAEATLPTLTLSPFNVIADTGGYVEGDVDLRVFADSTFDFTEGIAATLSTLTLTAIPPGIELGEDSLVTVTSTPALNLTDFPVDAANPVVVAPLTPSLTLASFATTAGQGTAVGATLQTLSIVANRPGVGGSGLPNEVAAGAGSLSLTAFLGSVQGLPQPEGIPPSTFLPDLIENPDATTDVPQNYVICDRTGFKIRPGTAVREWNGRLVRPESYEARHPQDFVRSRSETLDGSPRPEQEDQFISELYPDGVSAADL